MSDVQDHNGLPEDELIAAEYALGVLAGTERAAAERRIERDPPFANLVAAWEHRLAPLAEEIATIAPPPHVWDRLAAALPRATFARRWPLAEPRLLARAHVCNRRLGRVLHWRAHLLSTLTQRSPLIAAIDGGGHHHFVATVDAKRGTIAVVPAAFSADATRVPELWLISGRQQTAPARHSAC